MYVFGCKSEKDMEKEKQVICRVMKFGETFKAVDLNFLKASRGGFPQGKSLIMETKGVKVMVSTDWLGPEQGLVITACGPHVTHGVLFPSFARTWLVGLSCLSGSEAKPC